MGQGVLYSPFHLALAPAHVSSGEHALADVAPVAGEKVPASQSRHVADELAPASDENLPAAHSRHVAAPAAPVCVGVGVGVGVCVRACVCVCVRVVRACVSCVGGHQRVRVHTWMVPSSMDRTGIVRLAREEGTL